MGDRNEWKGRICLLCGDSYADGDEGRHAFSERHQMAAAKAVTKTVKFGYCPYCRPVRGEGVPVKNCHSEDHAKKIKRCREIIAEFGNET